MVPVAPESQGEGRLLRLAISRNSKNDVQIPSGPGLGAKRHGKAANEGPSQTRRSQVHVEPYQRFLKTDHRERALVFLCEPGVGTLLSPGDKALPDLLFACMWVLSAKVLLHDLVGELEKVERRSGAGQDLGIADQFHPCIVPWSATFRAGFPPPQLTGSGRLR